MSIRRRSAYPRRARDERLRLTENGTFQISVFSDLHFAEGTTTNSNNYFEVLTIFKDDKADNKTIGVMNSVLSSEEVQLVVLNGDLISGEATTQRSNSSLYVDRIVAPLVDRNLPWASTYGNHDSEINLDPEEIFHEETKYENSLTQRRVSGSTAGITNYYLPIFPHASNDSTPVFILWFFDSQGGHYALAGDEDRKSVARQSWVDDKVSTTALMQSRDGLAHLILDAGISCRIFT